MKLSDIATIKTNFPDADFWLIRRGSLKTCGKPVNEFYKEHIGIKIENTEILNPRFFFYVMEDIHTRGLWEAYATGTLSLVNIKVSDVRKIELI